MFGQRGCISGKVVVFRQSGCIRAKWFYSVKVGFTGQSGCIWAKVVTLRQIIVLRQNWLYSANWFFLGKCGCIRAKQLYSGKVVVNFGKSGCFSAKLVIFLQIWFYLGR